MLDRVVERLFGFCPPYSLKPDGLRVQGTLPAGYSGFGPLDATPMWYVPVPVLPMILPLEYRTDLAEAGWGQAPYESILESVRAMSIVTNQRIIFIGSSRSETNEEGVYLVPRGSLGSSIGCIAQLGSIEAAGDPQIHVYKVRKEDSASSGIFLTPPGAGFILRDEAFGTSNRDVFLAEAIGTLERRALQKIPAAELVYSCKPRGNRGPILLRYLGLPAILPLFGFIASDVEKRSPAVFHPTNATARYKVASRSAKRVAVDAADAAKALDRQKVAKPAEQQTL